jgi:hypothetical protein
LWNNTTQALNLLKLEEKAEPGGIGPHRRISFKFEYLGKFKFIFKTALGYQYQRIGGHVSMKKTRDKISRVSVPLRATCAGRDTSTASAPAFWDDRSAKNPNGTPSIEKFR